MELQRKKIQSGQGMIKVKTRIEVRMDDGRLWVRTRKKQEKERHW